MAGDVATNKERLLSRRRESEAAGPAVQMGVRDIRTLKLGIGNHEESITQRFYLDGSGRSAAWLARLPWEQEVGRSNRLAPTIITREILKHGDAVEVIKPKTLRDLIKAEAKKIAKVY
jgi:hypothetical protein